jgi:hypothetical protein
MVNIGKLKVAGRSFALMLVLGLLLTAAAVALRGSGRQRLQPTVATQKRVNPRQAPRYDPANFSARVDNAWYPLKPGITYIYHGTKDGKRARDVYRVTHQTITIDGVSCRVVKDRLFLKGKLEERTKDYYTQDEDGNVWYFGEDTAELDTHGNVVTTEGSWRTGRNGAQAGIFMQADPQVGDQFMQEFLRHHAEDHYKVLSLAAKVKVPFGTFGRNKLKHNVELTKEWTPLEPKVRDHKVYVRGIGEVKEKTVKGGLETARLVRIIKR